MIDRLLVKYWHSPVKELPFTGTEDVTYNERKRNTIINKVVKAGYNVMLQTITPSLGDSYMIIWIDKYRFQQR